MKMTECEIWLIVDEDENFVAAETEVAAAERYQGEVSDDAGEKAIRRIRVTVKVPVPETINAVAVVADEEPKVEASAS